MERALMPPRAARGIALAMHAHVYLPVQTRPRCSQSLEALRQHSTLKKTDGKIKGGGTAKRCRPRLHREGYGTQRTTSRAAKRVKS